MIAGGKERRLTELMKAFKSNPDIQFELAVMDNEIHYKEVLELPVKVHYLIRKRKKDFSIFKKFYKVCKNYKPDIVHCWDSMTAIYAIPACKLLHIKLVNGMVVDTPVNQTVFNRYRLRAKLVTPFSDIVVGNSRAGLTAYGVSKEKSACIYNGMNLTRFEHIKDSSLIRKEIFGNSDAVFFVAGMVAAFEDRKDHITLIKAATTLVSKYDNIRFVLVGDGAYLQEVKDSVPQSLLSRIIFLGKRSDIESIVNIFDVGILLTNSDVHGEGISNSIIEYMALGKPVIATRGGGTNELVFEGHNGFLVDAFNVEQVVRSVEALLNNKELSMRFGENGIQTVREKFDIKKIIPQYIHTYQKLVKEK